MPLLRREFLISSSAAAGAVLFAGCVPPQQKMAVESRVLMAEDILSGYDTWFATTCRGCDAGCGAIVRVVDGRARKVEGNPEHPLNQGKLCARGQALVQEQYHPDRLTGPLQRDPSRRLSGSGGFSQIGWPSALETLVDKLTALVQQGRGGDITLITPPVGGHQAMLVQQFTQALGAKWYPFEAVGEEPLRAAVRQVFGFQDLPHFDVQHARTILSIGADWLGAWLSPVRYNLEYGIFRQGSYAAGPSFQPKSATDRGRLIHVESRFSMTAASADEWVWVRPGAEGVFALAVAQALGSGGLDSYAPEVVADRTGVAASDVRRIAAELTSGGPSLVMGGGSAGAFSQGTAALAAILGLNVVLNNVGKPGGILAPASPPLPGRAARSAARPLADWQDLVARMRDGREQAILVLGGADPVHGLPTTLGFANALQQTAWVGSFNSFHDETTRLADLVLPSSLALESFGDAVAEDVLSVQQPVVSTLYDTRSVWDVLLAVADRLNLGLGLGATYKDVLQSHLASLGQWEHLLQHGYATAEPRQGNAAPAAGGTTLTDVGEAQFAGDPQTYPYVLVPFQHNTLGTGEGAHLPWLQSAPDPTTTVTWQTWIELHPRIAADLQVAEGDLVTVESPQGRVEVPVYVSPAAPPEVVAMPFGQGHTTFGRWASGRGANPMDLLAPVTDSTTGALAYASTRVRLSKTGKHMPLSKLEGEAPVRQLPGREVLKVQHT